MNRIGVIDAVLTDDVDTFLFGAKMVIRKYVTHTLCGQYMLSPLAAKMPPYQETRVKT